MDSKIKSVLQLSRYKINDKVWWVVIRPNVILPALEKPDQWMNDIHPKELYNRGPYKPFWDYKNQLPKLHHLDFSVIINLLCSKIVIEEFIVDEIYRSDNTGEFYYANLEDEWMPESFLFDSLTAARRERTRILKMFQKWLDR